MPILTIHGVPEDMPKKALERYWKDLRKEVASIPELNLKAEQVSAFFPSDRLSTGLGEEIIIFVDGLFERPDRTTEVQNELAGALVKITAKHFRRNPLLVECFVRSFNPATCGFSTFKRLME